jgi:QueT transporter
LADQDSEAAKPIKLEVPYRIDLRSNSRRIALISTYTAAYVAIVYLFPYISYGQLNIRVADFLRGLLPFFPEPLIIGNAFATFLSDLSSPFGYLDFVGSTLVILVSITVATRIFRIRFKGNIVAGYIVHSLILSTWLTTLISSSVLGTFHFADSQWLAFAVWIYGGNVISDVVLPYTFFQVLKKRLWYPGRTAS